MFSLSFVLPLAAAGQQYASVDPYIVTYTSVPPAYPGVATTTYPQAAQFGGQYTTVLPAATSYPQSGGHYTETIYYTTVDPNSGYAAPALPADFGALPADFGALPADFGALPADFGVPPAGTGEVPLSPEESPDNAPESPKPSALKPVSIPQVRPDRALDAIKDETKQSLRDKMGKQKKDHLVSVIDQVADQKSRIQSFYQDKVSAEKKSIDKQITEMKTDLAKRIAQLEEQKNQIQKAAQKEMDAELARKTEELEALVANMNDNADIEKLSENVINSQQIVKPVQYASAPAGKDHTIAAKIESWKQELGR